MKRQGRLGNARFREPETIGPGSILNVPDDEFPLKEENLTISPELTFRTDCKTSHI